MYSIKNEVFAFYVQLRIQYSPHIQCSKFTVFDTIIELNKSLLERNIAEQYRILSVVLCWLLIPFKAVQAKYEYDNNGIVSSDICTIE